MSNIEPYSLAGKVAIVTGAGSGIGHAVTRLLLAAGSSVILADLSLRPEAEQTVAEYHHPAARPGSASALFHHTDVTNWAHLASLWDTAVASLGRVDLVVSVAGIYEPPSSSFWKPPGLAPESRDQPDAFPGQYATFAVNQIAPIRLAQIALDYWTQNRDIQGNYLAVASMAGYLHSIETPLYMASKAALISFVKSLGLVRDLFGIRFSAVCPGPVLVRPSMIDTAMVSWTPSPNSFSRMHTRVRLTCATQTPIFEPEWNKKLTQDDVSLSAKQCSDVIVRVLVEPQWGNGSIVETQMLGDKTTSKVVVRDVQMEALYPTTFVKPGERVIESRENLIKRIKAYGMRG
ncbi:hypothetical protein G7054_g8244 [Neopestalotiopsis clavispora]|nr:hypothetical protein G7054_g8244 [Neopestalotiopsis clavispora]